MLFLVYLLPLSLVLRFFLLLFFFQFFLLPFYPKCDFLIFRGLIFNLVLLHDLFVLVIADGGIFFPIPNFFMTAQIGAHFVCRAFTANFSFFCLFLIGILYTLQKYFTFCC